MYTTIRDCFRPGFFSVLLLTFLFQMQMLSLQSQDTTKSQTVQIISSYKPVLRPSTKLSFSASSIPPAPFSDKFSYQLPDQQFKVKMKPVTLVPADFVPDSLQLNNQHFIKLGYGNYRHVYADAGASLGTGKPVQLQLLGGHHSLKGDLPFQQNSRTYASAYLQFYRPNHRIYTKSDFQQTNYYYYGKDSTNNNAKKDSLRQTFNHYNIALHLTNNKPNAYGINYHPSLNLHVFNDRTSNEVNALVQLPFYVNIKEHSVFSMQMEADLTRYKPADTVVYANNIFAVNPSITFPVKDLSFDVGGRFAWDQGNLNFLPQIGCEVFLLSNRAILMGGWKSSIQKNNFLSLTSSNPWIRQPLAQYNTRTDEIFGGLRGDLPINIHYRFRGGITSFRNLPLFVNVKQGSVFDVEYEKSLRTFHLQGGIEWLPSEKINVGVTMEVYKFIQQKTDAKPWHFIPLQINFNTTWKPMKHLMIQSKIFGWKGPYVKTDLAGSFKKLPSVVDANLEADFRFNKLFSVWVQFNNLFNQAYERWYQYPVVGLQIVGGIRLNFDQNQ